MAKPEARDSSQPNLPADKAVRPTRWNIIRQQINELRDSFRARKGAVVGISAALAALHNSVPAIFAAQEDPSRGSPEVAGAGLAEGEAEAPILLFPRTIGNLETDQVQIINMGSKKGVIDNQEDPNNNWQAISAAAKEVAPKDKFRIYFYDDVNQVPQPENPPPIGYPLPGGFYAPSFRWGEGTRGFPTTEIGRQLMFQAEDGVWEFHTSLPPVLAGEADQANRPVARRNVDPNYRNQMDESVTHSVLTFFAHKDNPQQGWPDSYARVLIQQVLLPAYRGPDERYFELLGRPGETRQFSNFPLKVMVLEN